MIAAAATAASCRRLSPLPERLHAMQRTRRFGSALNHLHAPHLLQLRLSHAAETLQRSGASCPYRSTLALTLHERWWRSRVPACPLRALIIVSPPPMPLPVCRPLVVDVSSSLFQ